MNEYEEKLKKYIRENSIQGEHLSFEQSCHSVEDASKAVNACEEDFVKNVCMIDSQSNLIVAIVKGEDRASTTQVGSVLNIERPRTATPEVYKYGILNRFSMSKTRVFQLIYIVCSA